MIVGIVKIGNGLIALEEFRKAETITEGVNAFCNENFIPLNPLDYLGIDASSNDRTKLWGYDFNEEVLKEITYILDSPAPVDLETYKNDIIQDIIEKRNYRLDNYYILAEYPENSGKFFDCSIEGQGNWDKLKSLFDLGHITGNFQVATFDRRDSYTIVDMADLSGLIASVSTAVLGERTVADTYISNVIAAADEEAAILAAKPYLEL